MTDFSRRAVLASTLAFAACSRGTSNQDMLSEVFICPPCGCSEDETEFDTPGRCPDCDMTLMPKHEKDLGFEPTILHPRAGFFQVAGGLGKEDRVVTVHYYLPDGFTRDSKILLIVPGAGRNSSDYRNAWLGAARKNNILIAALGYPENEYDLAAYNMGGVLQNFRAQNIITSTPGVIRARDEDIQFDINANKAEWLFNDFDRIFDLLKGATGSVAATYNIFGHSAGGQILHRMALFHPVSKANKIIAANAGWYTLPDLASPIPTGLEGTQIKENELIHSLSLNLVILLGENDNSDRAGGTLLHTPAIDKQGLDRLSRGKNFYTAGLTTADALGVSCYWRLMTVPKVGHEFRKMSEAAAKTVLN